MTQLDRGICHVPVLSAWTGTSTCRPLQVSWINPDLELRRFWQNSYCYCAGLNSTPLVVWRHPLPPHPARFVTKCIVRALPGSSECHKSGRLL